MGVSFSNCHTGQGGQHICRAELQQSPGGKWEMLLMSGSISLSPPFPMKKVALSPTSSPSSSKMSPGLASAHFTTPDAQRLLKVTSQGWVRRMGMRRCPMCAMGIPLL